MDPPCLGWAPAILMFPFELNMENWERNEPLNSDPDLTLSQAMGGGGEKRGFVLWFQHFLEDFFTEPAARRGGICPGWVKGVSNTPGCQENSKFNQMEYLKTLEKHLMPAEPHGAEDLCSTLICSRRLHDQVCAVLQVNSKSSPFKHPL